MRVSLDEVCAILDEFEKEITEIQTIWRKQSESHSCLEQASSENFQEEYHRMWLHGATKVWERNELERWLYGDLPATKTALSPAIDIYKAWRKWLKISGIPKATILISLKELPLGFKSLSLRIFSDFANKIRPIYSGIFIAKSICSTDERCYLFDIPMSFHIEEHLHSLACRNLHFWY